MTYQGKTDNRTHRTSTEKRLNSVQSANTMTPSQGKNEIEESKQDKAVYQQSPRSQVTPFHSWHCLHSASACQCHGLGHKVWYVPRSQNLEEILVLVVSKDVLNHSLTRHRYQPKRWVLEEIHPVGASSGQNSISPAAAAEAIAPLLFLPSRAVAPSVQRDQEGPQRLHRIHDWIQPFLCPLCGSSFHLGANAQIQGPG